MARVLPSAVTSAIAGNEIWTVRFVDIQIGDTTYRISDHYRELSFNSNTYLPNGVLLSIDNITLGTSANNDSVDISLSAIESAFRADVLDADAIGGNVTVYRGLINADTGQLIADPIVSYQGVIFSVTLSEDGISELGRESITVTGFTATADVRSVVFRLDERPGTYTNDDSQRSVDPSDRSMEFVAGLDGRVFTFGGNQS